MAVVLAPLPAAATPTVTDVFEQLYNVGVNTLGFFSGTGYRVGARVTSANGNTSLSFIQQNVTASITSPISTPLQYTGSPVIGALYQRIFTGTPPAGPFTLSFSDGVGVPTVVSTPALPNGATQTPFVQSITLSGTMSSPTFSWAPPPGTQVGGYRINIYDPAQRGGVNATGQIYSRDFAPSVTSFTIPTGQSVPGLQSGYTFNASSRYSIEISLLQTRPGATSTANPNVYALSRVYADFTLSNNSGGPAVNLPLSKLNPTDPYEFNMAVTPGVTYYIDPEVATGFTYAIGAGNPNFASVLLPTIQAAPYHLSYTHNGTPFDLLLAGGMEHFFPSGGVSTFTVTGIDPGLGLDPGNPLAFITGLSFTGPGRFTGTMTPITTFVDVPEPAAISLFALGLGGLILRRRRIPQPA